MIIGIFHQGSGLGNQLHRYVATRVRATDLGVDWAMMYNPDGSGKEMGFKGRSFMDINWQIQEDKFLGRNLGKPNGTIKYWNEKMVVENGVDIRSYDPEFNFIQDNTIIDGEFQDERYWEHREKEVGEWLQVESLEMPDDLCLIGFRGGEFSIYPDLFLTKEYWEEGIRKMLKINPNMRFEVHTDDKPLAEAFFNYEFPVIHDVAINWRSMRYAKYAIISNSSFCILPRWLRQGKNDGSITICPRFWGRRNTKVWSLPQNYYSRFIYT